MLTLLLLACTPTPLTDADVDAVEWTGEFTWTEVDVSAGADLTDPGLVEFTLEADGDDAYTGSFHYADPDSEAFYAVSGRLDEGVLTLTQTAIVADVDLAPDHVWCQGDYVLTMDEHGDLVGDYFPWSAGCMEYAGTVRFGG